MRPYGGAVVQIDTLLGGDGIVFIPAGRGQMDQFRLIGVLPSCAGAAMKDSAGNVIDKTFLLSQYYREIRCQRLL